MSNKRTKSKDVHLRDIQMPFGLTLADYSAPEVDVMRRWFADAATIGDLHEAGPNTRRLAFEIARDVVLGVEASERAVR